MFGAAETAHHLAAYTATQAGPMTRAVLCAAASCYPARRLSHACNPFSAELLAFANAPGCVIILYDLGEQASHDSACRAATPWRLKHTGRLTSTTV